MSLIRPISQKGHIDKGARSGFARKEKGLMSLRSVLRPDLNFRGIPQAILQFHQNTILPSAMGQWIAFRSLNSSLSGGNIRVQSRIRLATLNYWPRLKRVEEKEEEKDDMYNPAQT